MIRPSLADKVADYCEEIDRLKERYRCLPTEFMQGAIDYYDGTMLGRLDNVLGRWNVLTPKKIVVYRSILEVD